MPEARHEPAADPTAAIRPDACYTGEDAESLGGDPACWAHLFEDDDPAPADQPVSIRILFASNDEA